MSKPWGRFRKYLWPSQKNWTLSWKIRCMKIRVQNAPSKWFLFHCGETRSLDFCLEVKKFLVTTRGDGVLFIKIAWLRMHHFYFDQFKSAIKYKHTVMNSLRLIWDWFVKVISILIYFFEFSLLLFEIYVF